MPRCLERWLLLVIDTSFAFPFCTTFFLVQDCELLYLSDRSENLVLRNIAVPPLAIRPSVFVDGGAQRSKFYCLRFSHYCCSVLPTPSIVFIIYILNEYAQNFHYIDILVQQWKWHHGEVKTNYSNKCYPPTGIIRSKLQFQKFGMDVIWTFTFPPICSIVRIFLLFFVYHIHMKLSNTSGSCGYFQVW